MSEASDPLPRPPEVDSTPVVEEPILDGTFGFMVRNVRRGHVAVVALALAGAAAALWWLLR